MGGKRIHVLGLFSHKKDFSACFFEFFQGIQSRGTDGFKCRHNDGFVLHFSQMEQSVVALRKQGGNGCLADVVVIDLSAEQPLRQIGKQFFHLDRHGGIGIVWPEMQPETFDRVKHADSDAGDAARHGGVDSCKMVFHEGVFVVPAGLIMNTCRVIAFGGTLVALVALAVACCWMWIAQKNAEELRQTEIVRREGESRALALQQAEAAARAAEARTSEERRLAAERERISEQKRKEAAAAERERQMAEKRRREEADRLQREQEERLAAEKRAREEAEQKKRREEESKRLRDEATQRALAFFADGKLKEGLEASKNGDSANPQLVFWSAVCAERGIGEPADEGKAAGLYRRAAEAGNPDAQHKYGLLCFLGRVVEKNVGEAMKWNQKAAENGSVKAQLFLAIQWDSGSVVPRNETKAEKWYRLAAENGNDMAMEWLRKRGK